MHRRYGWCTRRRPARRRGATDSPLVRCCEREDPASCFTADRCTRRHRRNCAAIVSREGEVAGTYRKVHPFSYGKEIDYYTGGDELVIRETAGLSICPQICYDPHLSYLGGSVIISPEGDVLAEAGADEEVVLQAELDAERLRAWRTEFPALEDIHAGFLGGVTVS